MKNKGLYNKKIVSKYLWRNYLVFIAVATLLILVPYFALMVVSNTTKDKVISRIYTADLLMKDTIEEIDISEVLAKNGSVDIITQDYRVHHLGGAFTFAQEKFSEEEFAQFLLETNSEHSNYTRSIAYNSKERFWLVVTFPVSIKILLTIQYNEESQDFFFIIRC